MNPKLEVSESAGSHGGAVHGTLDSTNGSETASLIDVTAAKEQKAPANPAASWSADSPY